MLSSLELMLSLLLVPPLLVSLLVPPDAAGTWSGGAGAGAGMQSPEVPVNTITFCPQDNPSNDIITRSRIAVNDGRIFVLLCEVGAAVGLIFGVVGASATVVGEMVSRRGPGAAALGETAGTFAFGEAAASDFVGAMFIFGDADDGELAHSSKEIYRSLSAIIVDTLAK